MNGDNQWADSTAGDPDPEEHGGFAPARLSDPRVMRALSHPVRLALIEALTFYGPLTATEAGERIEESPTTCSFHLRQLAKYGLVEEAGGGRGRSRPWQMRQLGFSISHEPADAEEDLAGQTLLAAALKRQVERHAVARRNRAAYPEPWRAILSQNDSVCWVNETEAAELRDALFELVMRFHDRLDPARRPADARPVELLTLLHPFEPPTEYR